MKYFARLSLPLIILLIGGIFCFAQGIKPSTEQHLPTNEYNPNSWKEFSSAEGRFSISFPGIPTELTQPVPLPNLNIVAHTFYLRTLAEYQATYVDYPFPIEGTDRITAFFNGVRDYGVKAINGRLLEEKEMLFDGHPGRSYVVEYGGNYILSGKMFVIKNRLYQLGATTYGKKNTPAPTARIYENAAVKFLDSFKLLSIQEAAKQAANKNSITDPTGVQTEEGEVERFLKQNNRKDIVLGRCLEVSQCKSVKGIMADGQAIKGDVVAGETINKPQPRYPAIAKAAHQSGTVVVAVIIDEEGKVIAAQVQSGPPLLRVAALDAVREVRFTPTLLDRKPVKVAGTITYNFTLKP